MLQNVELPFCIYLISLQTCTSNGLPTGSSILYHWEPCLPVMWLQPLRSLTRMAMVSLASLNLLMHLGISNRISMDIQILQIFFGCFFGASRWFCVFFFWGGVATSYSRCWRHSTQIPGMMHQQTNWCQRQTRIWAQMLSGIVDVHNNHNLWQRSRFAIVAIHDYAMYLFWRVSIDSMLLSISSAPHISSESIPWCNSALIATPEEWRWSLANWWVCRLAFCCHGEGHLDKSHGALWEWDVKILS